MPFAKCSACSTGILPVGPVGILPADYPSPGYLAVRRIINFNPDHTSSTAQTFTSTRPIGSARSRIVSSVILLVTPELFFGQETQITPPGTIFFR